MRQGIVLQVLSRVAAILPFVVMVMPMAAMADASPIQFNFTGVTTYAQAGGPIGETASGSLTFDPATLERHPQIGDGSTFVQWEGTYWSTAYCPECELVRQSNPTQINGEASARSDVLRFGGGFTYDFASVSVFRNYGGSPEQGFNQYRVVLTSIDDPETWRTVSIYVNDYLGLGTGIFVESDGGLSPAQAIDWFAPGSVSKFEFYESRAGTRVTEFQGLLTSVQTTKVPEPGTMLQQLLTDVTGVGPGKSLAKTIKLAQTYYAVPDVQATCAVMRFFDYEVRVIWKLSKATRKVAPWKITTEQMDDLLGQSGSIQIALGCD